MATDSLFDPSAPLAARVPAMAKPLSYLKPTTPYGDNYTQSYTRYLNAPFSSYVHPLFPLFNDRRPQPQKIRTTLNTPGRVPGSV